MLKIVELFAGIGAIRKAIINLNIPHQVIDCVEIDNNCIKSYNQLYNTNYQPQSVLNYKLKDEPVDILMHGSPCQDFSSAGHNKGGDKDSGTRSSLLFETIRIIKEAKYKPKWVIWENVKAVLNKRHKNAFYNYLKELEDLGYITKYAVLNANDYGIPQKRERLFAISCLDTNYFDFEDLPKSKPQSINHYLDNDVNSKYIVKQPSMLSRIGINVKIIDDYCYTITTKQQRAPNAGIIKLDDGLYRYLTEKECFRLMGFSDDDFNKLRIIYPDKENTTNLILYQQAGNSIVVKLLELILNQINQLNYGQKD
ncbi:DNA cytosine methyltransferase [Ureaplasma diversum]|uniref:Cytosine-specific methyltransferase n=1 Tax=Ureaplasma diversum NCTC 246 TaxID=1188241 RepID=A0A084EZ26_9BACT|nr:DNA (cytosine-5-)-methyltransferase [Ureaplasma diversum]KEZ23218.1 Cytosine specific DNA methyltransferase [Ureaplasma diversum NCTC 246]